MALVLLIAAALPMRATGQEGARWWDPQWQYRRAVTVDPPPPTGLPGSEVAVAVVLTAGLAAPDGRDIRVAPAGAGWTPHRVLQVGPGDQVRVAFALKPGVDSYFVYFGNPAATEPEEKQQLNIQRGVLMETYEYAGGAMNDLEQARKTFARATKLLGRDFRPDVFIGHNPFGPQSALCSRVTAWLVAPADGEYTFAVSSRDASFLLVDDREVVSSPGRHNPDRDIRHNAKTTLKKGPHKLQMLHVNTGGDPVAVAAWQAPGDQRVWTIPREAFTVVAQAKPGLLKQFNQPVTADFDVSHAGEAFLVDRYTQRYIFRERVSEGFPRAAKIELAWDLGDGQTSADPTVEHVYLSDGTYTVTLTAKTPAGTFTRTNRVFVSRDWDRVTLNVLDAPQIHARFVARYDLAKMNDLDVPTAAILLDRAREVDALMNLADAVVGRSAVSAAALKELLPRAVECWRQAGRGKNAVEALKKAAALCKDAAVAADLTVLAGRVLLEDVGDADAALELFDRAMKDYAALTNSPAVRAAQIGIGDVWRFRGDYEKAKAAYEQAAPAAATVELATVRRGDLARHVEEYIRTGQLNDAEDFLDQWENDLPLDRLAGYSTIMRVRLRGKQRRWDDVARQAEALVKVNPQSHYAPELLLNAAEAYRKLGRSPQAAAALGRIVKEYPESALAAQAKKELEGK